MGQNNPISGSILLGAFVLGIYMVLMNMWYALMLHAFSQTRERLLEQQEAKGEKSLVAEFMEGIMESMKGSVDIEKIVKKFPGLYARTVVKWRRQTAKVSKRRERRLAVEAGRQMTMRLDRIRSGYTIMPFHKSLDPKELSKAGGVTLGLENGGRGLEI